MLDYIKSRIKERTSWDGGVIIAGPTSNYIVPWHC